MEVVIVTPPTASTDIDMDLVNLTEFLHNRLHPGEPTSGGILGGEYGYGVEFENDVFSMFPFYWGDCTCPFGALDEFDPPEDADCYQVELKAREIAAGVHYSQQRDSPYDETEAIRRSIYRELTTKYGLPMAGCAVHCTCSRKRRWQEWFDAHKLGPDGHAPECPTVKPNFLHKASDLHIRWYKWIGRGMEFSRKVAPAEWRRLFAECVASIERVEEPPNANPDPEWQTDAEGYVIEPLVNEGAK